MDLELNLWRILDQTIQAYGRCKPALDADTGESNSFQ